MTRSEWNERMQRWMHRRDIAADLDAIWEFATAQFYNSWLKSDARDLYATDDDLCEAAPSPMLHAGLMYLHELAQDDEGVQRESRFFGTAMEDFVLNYSISNIQPSMTRPYYPEETT